MSYGLSSANLNEPIQIATKVLLPVTAIQPILVAEPPVVQQTGSFVEVEHGQNPSCSVWNGFQTVNFEILALSFRIFGRNFEFLVGNFLDFKNTCVFSILKNL